MHNNLAKAIALLGFSLLGLLAGLLIVPILTPIGILYQILKVTILLIKGLCGGTREIQDEQNLSDFDSPTKSPYQTLPSSQQSSNN